MPSQITLFSEDGQWRGVVSAWTFRFPPYRSIGTDVRLYRLSYLNPGPWGYPGPYASNGPWGPMKGPWGGFKGPWRGASGPWGGVGSLRGPWGAIQYVAWVESPARSIQITNVFTGHPPGLTATRERVFAGVGASRLKERAFGALRIPSDEGESILVQKLESKVKIQIDEGLVLEGSVETEIAHTR